MNWAPRPPCPIIVSRRERATSSLLLNPAGTKFDSSTGDEKPSMIYDQSIYSVRERSMHTVRTALLLLLCLNVVVRPAGERNEIGVKKWAARRQNK